MSTVAYKCPNCASDIKFDSSSQKFRCESCDAEFTEQELNEIHNFEENQPVSVQGYVKTENLVTVMWANEQFDPNKPDTFFEEV